MSAPESVGGGEAAHEGLFAGEEVAEGGASRVCFDVALDIGKFALKLCLAEGFEAALRFLPGRFGRFFKEDFEKDTAVAVCQHGGDFGGFERLAGQNGEDESGEDFFGFEAVIELRGLKFGSEIAAKDFGFGKHANQAAFNGLGGTADEFGLGFDFAAALGGGLAESSAKDGFFDTELLGDTGGPFGTKNAIRDFLHVGQ